MRCPNCGNVEKKDVWTHVRMVWSYRESRCIRKICKAYCIKCGAFLGEWEE